MAAGTPGIRIALPKGRLEPWLAALRRSWGFPSEEEAGRVLRFPSGRYPTLIGRVLHERDVPVQVSVGNYALGICGSEWVEEALTRFPSEAIVLIERLPVGRRHIFAAVSQECGEASWAELRAQWEARGVRLASEFPHLAEAFALRERLRRFRIFPLWGAAEAYPPEDADVVIVAAASSAELEAAGLRSIAHLLEASACVVAHRKSIERQDLSLALALLHEAFALEAVQSSVPEDPSAGLLASSPLDGRPADALRLALPDGHLAPPVVRLLERSGLRVPGYDLPLMTRRTFCADPPLQIKVVRPQDMPLQVANGHFHVAITGQDRLQEHRVEFPASPVVELCSLGFGRVRIVAVIPGDWPVHTVEELRQMALRWRRPLRIASEYPHLADHYARTRHLAPYKVIPSWGATEGFLPDDADLLIENTETGTTIARHGLRILEEIMPSSACFIAHGPSLEDPVLGPQIRSLAERLQAAAMVPS